MAATDEPFVRLHIGAIADMADYLPGGDLEGSEILASASGASQRSVSREQRLFHLSIGGPIGDFLRLPEVAAVLATQANILVESEPQETAYASATTPCTTSQVNVTPTANQCCYDGSTRFIRSSDLKGVLRHSSSFNGPCIAQDEETACSGADCYYGPNGFARAVVTTFNYTLYDIRIQTIRTAPNNYWCAANQYAKGSAPAPEFANVTGTFPLGAGCCIDTSGPCNAPGHPACSQCGGGGSAPAGAGAWDY